MKKVVLRKLPYSYVEPEALENWLEEQAREGLFLTDHIPVFLPWHHFERRAPAPARYRVQLRKESLSREERDAATALGWTYMLPYGKAHIYRTNDPSAPDLRRNPEAVAELRGQSRRMYHKNVLVLGLVVLVSYLTLGWSAWTGSTLDALLSHVSPYHPVSFWITLLLPLLIPVSLIAAALQSFRMPKEFGDPPRPKKPRIPPMLCMALQVAGTVLILLLTFSPFLPARHLYSPDPLPQAALRAISYPLLQDLSPQAEVTSEVYRGRHLLAPSLLNIRQEAGDDSYQLHIYQTRSPWIARWFTKDCISYFGHQYTAGDPIVRTVDLPPHDLDFAAYYTVTAPADSPWSYTRHVLILREGNTVLEADYEGSFDMPSLLPQFATALKHAG